MSNTYAQKSYNSNFNVFYTFKDGFQNIKGVKFLFLSSFSLFFLINFSFQNILFNFFPLTPSIQGVIFQELLVIATYPIIMPILVGIIMLAIKNSRGEDLKIKSIFGYYHLTWKLTLAALLIKVITLVGFLFFIIPGIYFSVSYAFTLPLIVDKGFGVWEAMEVSRKTVSKHWFKFFGFFFLSSLIIAIGAIPLGIGLIWFIPLFFVTTYGLLYPLVFDEVPNSI